MKLYIYVLAAFGLFCVWGGVTGLWSSYALQRRGVRAKGVVVDSVGSGARSFRYYPVIEYPAADGKSHRFQAWSGSTEKGTAADVIYLADDPAVAKVAGSEKLVSGSVAVVILGLVLLAPLSLLFIPGSAPGSADFLGRFVTAAKWFAVVLIAGTGLAFFAYGATWGVKRYVLLRTGVRGEGTVVDYVTTRNSAAPVIEFTANDGQTHRFVATTGAKYPDHAHLEVIYNPDDPSVAALTEFQHFWLGALVTTGFGLFFLFFGALAYRFLIQSPD